MNADPLSPLLSQFSARARLFYTGHLCQHVPFEASAGAGYLHLLRAGEAWFIDGSGTRSQVKKPTLVFFARPLDHRIEVEPVPGAELACASVLFDHATFNPIALALPPRYECPLADLPDADTLLRQLFDEAFAARAGRVEVLNRLFELVLIHLLRHAIAHGNDRGGLLPALAHPQIGRVLSALHSAPGKAWTLASMSTLAAMSRASFAVTFRRTVGYTPIEYLTRWRISWAQALLSQGRPQKLVADQVGYCSQAGFLRAFKSVTTLTPTQWLRAQNQDSTG